MTDWEDAYRDLGREMDAMERGASSMEREMDRMIQEINDLKQENAGLRLENQALVARIQQLEDDEMDRYEEDRIASKTRQE